MKLKEKELQWKFVSYLKSNGWTVWEQVRSLDGKYADVIAYRSDIDAYIGFELKIMHGVSTWTKALHQIIGYRKKTFKINPSLWCLVIPPHEKDEDYFLWPIRFFWRFGVGICFFPTEHARIGFINSKPKDTIFLNKKYWRKNTPENTSRLAKKIQKEYVDYDK